MSRIIKKSISLCLAVIMTVASMSISILGAENVSSGNETTYVKTTKEERDAQFDLIIDQILSSQITPQGSAYKYKFQVLSQLHIAFL